jgi:prevent-host-death family protein
MYTTKGIEAVATITELRSKTSTLIDRAKDYRGIMIQKNNEPYAVLLSYDTYMELIGEKKKK